MAHALKAAEPLEVGAERGLLFSVAALAADGVRREIDELRTGHGRSGIIVQLRIRALQLASSAVGRDQIASRAFDAAADDLAWGRAPLTAWDEFSAEAPTAAEHRLRLRAALERCAGMKRQAVSVAVQEIENRCIAAARDAFDAARSLGARLTEEARLQEMLWDDPRIAAGPEVRALMLLSVEPLRARAQRPQPGMRPVTRRLDDSEAAPRRLRGWGVVRRLRSRLGEFTKTLSRRY